MAVNHVVYFKFTDDATLEQVAAHMDAFAALGTSIPGIIGYSAGKTFPVEYEKTADYDCAHVVAYESEQALEDYFFHPQHQAFIAQFKHIWKDVAVVNAQID